MGVIGAQAVLLLFCAINQTQNDHGNAFTYNGLYHIIDYRLAGSLPQIRYRR